VPTRDDYERAGLLTRVATSIDDRLAYLDWLASQGCTIDEMVEAHARGELQALAADRSLGRVATLTLTEAAEHSGMDVEVLRAVLRASGFRPDDAPLTEASLELFTEFETARTMFSDAEALHFTRVMGSSLARIAEAANSLFLVDVESPMKTSAPSELRLAQQSLLAMASLDNVANAIGALFRLHMQDATARSRRARLDVQDPDLARLAVGFVDLVGFTPLTAASSARELISLVLTFESRAYDLVTDHGGRVVKLIGDEVMFVAFDPDQACDIVRAMFAELQDTGVTPRAGIAFGDVLAHGGDYYGSIVNLAARIADIAVPWEILVSEDVATGVTETHELVSAGRRMLKGFPDPVSLFEVRR
jgi:adenylate cyclase